MDTKIEHIAPSAIAYIRRFGAYGVENIQTMERLKSWATASNLMNENTVILGVAHDNAQSTTPENCRYDACILLVDHPMRTDDSIQIGRISGGKYAVFTIPHTAPAMEQAWADIFPALFEAGYSIDDTRPILERYTAQQVSNHSCELCVPLL